MVSSCIVTFILEATSMDVQLQGEALAEHTTALLVKGASKLTMGQSLPVMTSYQVQNVLETKGHQ